MALTMLCLYLALQHFNPTVSRQRFHHLFGAGIEPQQTLSLGYSLPDQLRVDAFQVCQDNQLLKTGLITDIARAIGVCLPPFFCSDTE